MKKFIFIIFGLICLCSCCCFNNDNCSNDIEIMDEHLPVNEYRPTLTKHTFDQMLYVMYMESRNQTSIVFNGIDGIDGIEPGEYHEFFKNNEGKWEHSVFTCSFCKEKVKEYKFF